MPLHRINVTLALGLLAAACSPNLYSPNTQNVLIAPEWGDLIAAGVANGSVLEQSPTTGKMNADVARVGIQPAIGFRSRFLEAAISARLIRLRYSNVEGSLVYDGERQDERLRDVSHYLLAEPAVTVRAGPDHLKLQLQVARSFNLTNPEFRQDRSMLTAGVVADVPTR